MVVSHLPLPFCQSLYFQICCSETRSILLQLFWMSDDSLWNAALKTVTTTGFDVSRSREGDYHWVWHQHIKGRWLPLDSERLSASTALLFFSIDTNDFTSTKIIVLILLYSLGLFFLCHSWVFFNLIVGMVSISEAGAAVSKLRACEYSRWVWLLICPVQDLSYYIFLQIVQLDCGGCPFPRQLNCWCIGWSVRLHFSPCCWIVHLLLWCIGCRYVPPSSSVDDVFMSPFF